MGLSHHSLASFRLGATAAASCPYSMYVKKLRIEYLPRLRLDMGQAGSSKSVRTVMYMCGVRNLFVLFLAITPLLLLSSHLAKGELHRC
jgi:hypothetical protein